LLDTEARLAWHKFYSPIISIGQWLLIWFQLREIRYQLLF